MGEWSDTGFAVLLESGALEIGDGYRAKNDELGGSGPIFLRAGHVTDTHIDFAGVERFRSELSSRVASKMSRAGDTVVTTKGNSTGRTAYVSAHMPPFVYSPHLCYWRSNDPGRLCGGFLRYWAQGPEFDLQLRSMMGSTDMAPYLSLTDQRRLRIRLPDVATQRAIAHILGTLDDKIELNRRTSETLEAMARALFKSWFVDFDPVRAKAAGKKPAGMDDATAKLFPSELVESEPGPVPKGWRASTLGVEVERCGGAVQTGPFGSQLHASDYLPVGIPVVMPKDIAGRRVSTVSIARVGEPDAHRLSRHRLRAGDIVYSRRGDVERHALIGDRETGWLCGTGCLLVRLGPRWPSAPFASFALDRPETRAWITQHAIGATMPNLNTGILSSVPLLMAPDELIASFGHIVNKLEDRIVRLDAESAALATTRDELLPKLLSGEISVREVA